MIRSFWICSYFHCIQKQMKRKSQGSLINLQNLNKKLVNGNKQHRKKAVVSLQGLHEFIHRTSVLEYSFLPFRNWCEEVYLDYTVDASFCMLSDVSVEYLLVPEFVKFSKLLILLLKIGIFFQRQENCMFSRVSIASKDFEISRYMGFFNPTCSGNVFSSSNIYNRYIEHT